MTDLETAASPSKLRRVAIDPLTRVEGHGKVTLLLDENNHIAQARLHVTEFRGFEKFIQGRPYWELPVLVQRLCGICPISHQLAAAKATDMLVGVERVTPTAEKVRRLMHLGQTLQSHALHFFHLSSPDLLFGFDDDVRHRNIVGLINDHPELARQGVLLRKYGQEILRITTGKRIHGIGAIPGGVNKSLNDEERDHLLQDSDTMIDWALDAVKLIKRIYQGQRAYHDEFGAIDSNMMSMVRHDGAHELYDGGVRVRDADGNTLLDHKDYRRYEEYLMEEVKSWSYMKFPFLSSLGNRHGWYRVGPLARLNNCDFMTTLLAEQERREFVASGSGRPVRSALAYHWARMIELLHCTENIRELLDDVDLLGKDCLLKGELRSEGFGAIEAPRGTLFHHYKINHDGLVEKANLIVPTTSNNQAMNESIRQVASVYLDGRTLNEPLLNQIEVAIRAYDPCLSCATHALGQMPLEIDLLDHDGKRVGSMTRNASGDIDTHGYDESCE